MSGREQLSRRAFLGAGAAAGALALGTGRADAVVSGLPSPAQVWEWQHQLVGFGTRYTGSAGHGAFVDWLGEQFAAVPGFRLRTDRKTFHRWLARDWSLSVRRSGVAAASPVPTTYYYPYSGTTGPSGVSAPMMDLGVYPPAVPGTSGDGTSTLPFWAPAAGKIAIVHAPPSTASLDVLTTATGGYERGRSSQQAALDYSTYAATLNNPAFNGIFAGVPLLDARNAGVRGVVVVWTGLPDDAVANQYNPFITPYASASKLATRGDPGCPALWVGEATGQALSQDATAGATATLTLTAGITEQAATNTLWGYLPGSSGTGESLLVNTHTDGPNATEENGALGMLALAQYFAGRPRRRDLYFVLVTGHFQLPQFTTTAFTTAPRPEVGNDATSIWLADHPELWRNTLAGLTVEHLGCTRWGVDDAGRYRRTGGHEWGTTYACQQLGLTSTTNTEEATWLAATRAVGPVTSPVVTVQPTPLYLGEGAPLYAAGLGTVSLVPLPPYLLQAGRAQTPALLNLDQLDRDLLYAQIQTFARTITALDRAPATAF